MNSWTGGVDLLGRLMFEYRAKRHSKRDGRCLIWTGARDRNGYGQVYLRNAGSNKRQRWRVHRAAWVVTNGPIEAGTMVCHTCDNPPCFRLSHLFAGSQADNLHDAFNKKRIHRNKEGRFA